jgi:hypothetical protein
MPQATSDKLTILSQSGRERLAQLMAQKGCRMAALLVGCSVQSLKVAVLGGTIRRGTALVLEQAIAERDAAGKVP